MLTRKTDKTKRGQRTTHNPIIQNQIEAQRFCRVQQVLYPMFSAATKTTMHTQSQTASCFLPLKIWWHKSYLLAGGSRAAHQTKYFIYPPDQARRSGCQRFSAKPECLAPITHKSYLTHIPPKKWQQPNPVFNPTLCDVLDVQTAARGFGWVNGWGCRSPHWPS